MATNKRLDAGLELVKVGVLAFFLYAAFRAASFATAFWPPFATLLKGALVMVSYLAGRHFATTYEEGWKNYLLPLYAAGVLALISWARYGEHTEDADPIRGGGDIVVDFAPTATARADHAINIFVVLLVPSLIGVCKKRGS